VQCAEALRVQAYFDGEVDALTALEVERHAGHCGECRELLEQLTATRARLRQELEFPQAPAALRASIRRLLDEDRGASAAEGPGRVRSQGRPALKWLGALLAGGAALAAAVLLFFRVSAATDPLLDDLLSAHVRSLMPLHLTDVVSTDRHTVKPWFAGHADVSPVVVDFNEQGYPLVGGRADYFDGQRVAAVVYRHGTHIINVFAWAAGGHALPEFSSRSGYHIVCWKLGNLQYCAISDTGWDELQALTRLLRAAGSADQPRLDRYLDK